MLEIGAIHLKAVIKLDNHPNRDYRSLPPSSAMSESKFDKAVAIIQALPKDGPVKPGVEDQLHVCPPFPLFLSKLQKFIFFIITAVLQVLQAR